jgi:hypothetical protein
LVGLGAASAGAAGRLGRPLVVGEGEY